MFSGRYLSPLDLIATTGSCNLINIMKWAEFFLVTLGGSRSKVVTHWTAGQNEEGLILHLGHDFYQNSYYRYWPRLSPTQYSLTVQNRGEGYVTFYATSNPVILNKICLYKPIVARNTIHLLFVTLLIKVTQMQQLCNNGCHVNNNVFVSFVIVL